ncbi:hypothetical protein C8Q70DRAFT_1028602 [Cubamyces menziesii]|nr:hypothetical protein C8Q70DRAFT_1028602 [Cubamyces menziesii]
MLSSNLTVRHTPSMKDTQSTVEAHDNPPWYAREPDGSIIFSGVPERLVGHPELVRRGIELDYAVKPGVVFESIAKDEGPGDRGFVVKALDLEDEELEIYERLLRCLDSPQNHTIPCEIVRSGHPMLIMPMLSSIDFVVTRYCKSFGNLADVFYQLIEGVAFLHKHRIAHMDLCFGNVGGALSSSASYHATLRRGRVYIYDFNTSRQFSRGPDSQHSITLPETQTPPPDGLTHFDPYSWDVYCLGVLFNELMDLYAEEKSNPPWLLHWYTRWLIASERGCRAVCRCRPTAQTALRVMSVVRWMVYALDWCSTSYQTFSTILSRAP